MNSDSLHALEEGAAAGGCRRVPLVCAGAVAPAPPATALQHAGAGASPRHPPWRGGEAYFARLRAPRLPRATGLPG
eukprot:4603556-Alexandrium_andersonii.AAC.1